MRELRGTELGIIQLEMAEPGFELMLNGSKADLISLSNSRKLYWFAESISYALVSF